MNFLRTLRRQGFDFVPLALDLCPSQVEAFKQRFGHTDYAAFFQVSHRYANLPLQAAFTDGHRLYPRETLPSDVSFDLFGVGHSPQPHCHHMTHMHHPLAGAVGRDEISQYPLPRIPPDAQAELDRQVRDIHSRDLAAVGSMACTIWETAWYLRSMEDLMADMMTEEAGAVIHFDRITDLACRRMEAYARSNCDVVMLGDDIGMQSTIMMSLELWTSWIKPRLARVIAAGRAIKPDLLIFYHSCGYVLPFIPHLIEVGVDILNPVQPECMAFKDVISASAGRLSFWGTIGTQTTLPFGKPADVRAAVLENLKRCGPSGGLVIAPTHLVEPEVPWENLVALKDAAAEFRS